MHKVRNILFNSKSKFDIYEREISYECILYKSNNLFDAKIKLNV